MKTLDNDDGNLLVELFYRDSFTPFTMAKTFTLRPVKPEPAPEYVEHGGKRYRVRYVYKRDDGTLWKVLDTNGETVPTLGGEFGDELQVE